MSSFFDDVFDNKILFEKEELLKSFNEKLNEEEKISEGDMSNFRNNDEELQGIPRKSF